MNLRRRPPIESALRLSLTELFKTGAIEVGANIHGRLLWSTERRKIAVVRYESILRETEGFLSLFYHWKYEGEAKDVQCEIYLSSLPLNYGGQRFYMHCPYTDQRALVLHKFPSIEKFCHRTAIRPQPTYASQRVGGLERVIDQRWALRQRLGDNISDLLSKPYKPKWMRWHTFERYVERDIKLARRGF